MANEFNVITKFLPQVIDEHFKVASKTAILEKGREFVDVNFSEAGYVKIASILLDGLGNYYKAQELPQPNDPANHASYAGNIASGSRDGFHIGGASVTWEQFRLQYVRSIQIKIDYISNEETANVMIANISKLFIKEKVIPEIDASRFSLITDKTSVSLGNRVVETVGANTIISKFNAAIEWLAENEVPNEDMVFFVSEPIMTQIRSTTELTKFITQGDIVEGINFTVSKYNGIPIISVPTNRFYTKISMGENGYSPTSDSKVINFIAMSMKGVTPVRKLEVAQIFDEKMSGLVGFYGYIFNYIMYHGLVVPRNKIPGIYASISEVSATTKTDLLRVATEEGVSQYHWKLSGYYTQPSGLRGYIVFKYAGDSVDPFALGTAIASEGTAGTDYLVLTEGADVTATSTQTTGYFALVGQGGIIIATSGSTAITLVRHA